MEDHLPAPLILETEFGMLVRVALWAFRLSVLVRASMRPDLLPRVQFTYSRIFPNMIYFWRV